MTNLEAQTQMFADLLNSESRALAEKHAVTQRALLYMELGELTRPQVLAALHCSQATWYRRVQDLRHWQAREGQR